VSRFIIAMLRVVMLSVIMLNVAMLNVVAPEKGSAGDFGRKMVRPNFQQNFDLKNFK